MLADAFVILVSLMLGAVALTQVLIPLIQNKPLFISFRKSYQREKWLKQQLEETKRRMAELELEKQLAEQNNELIRRQMEQMESYSSFTSPSVEEDERGMNRRRGIPEKEQ
jgi:hypothetical protein